jgi:hypothetical protein
LYSSRISTIPNRKGRMMETEAWIAAIGLVVVLGIALRYVSSNSYNNTQKPKDWELLSLIPEIKPGTFRIRPTMYPNETTRYVVDRYNKSKYSTYSYPYYFWQEYWDGGNSPKYHAFDTETEAQLFIDSFLETERVAKEKENRRR